MIKIKMLNTGEIKEVTPNIAFGLIDSKQAVKFTEDGYVTRQMTNTVREVPQKSNPQEKKTKENYKMR